MDAPHNLGSPSPGDTPKSTIPNDAKVFFIAQPVNKWVLKWIALPPPTASRKLGDLMPREIFQGQSGPRGLAESQAATV